MAGPEIIIPAIISAAGTYMQYSAQKDAEAQRKRQLNDMMGYQAAQSQKITNDVLEEVPRYTQQNMQAETGQIQQASEDRLMKDLKTALDPNTRPADVGKVSSDYLAGKAKRATEEADRGARLVRLFSAIDAPGQTRLKQSLDAADAAARRQAIAGGTKATLGQMSNQYQTIQPDAALTTGGGLLIGGANAYSNSTASDRIREALQKSGGPTIFNPPNVP